MEEHDWGGWEDVCDKHYGVQFGRIRHCKRCGAKQYDDWASNRVGSVIRTEKKKCVPKKDTNE